MNRKCWLLLGVLIMSLGLRAQSGLPVLMTEVGKGVKYADGSQSAWIKIKTPGVASTAGRLKLGGKSRVELYCNGATQTLAGKGEYALNEIFRAQLQGERSEWDGQFNTFLAAAGNTSQGFAKKLPADNAPIKAIAPVAGPVATFDLHFYWRTEQNADSLRLEITDTEGKVVYTADVGGGEAVVDPRKARLFPSQNYNWRVFSPSQPNLVSQTKSFQMNTLGQKGTVLPALKEQKSYQEAPPFMQTLMEAAYFEKEGWYYDAHQAYRTLLKQGPENALYQLFYKIFLQRCGVE